MNVFKILLTGLAFTSVLPASTSILSLPKSRLQQTCELIVSNAEQNKTENTLPLYSEHHYLMGKINTYLNTLHTPPL